MPATPTPGPCAAWVNAARIAEYRPDITAQIDDPNVLNTAINAASDLMYVLSGRQFNGQCEKTIRPTARPVSFGISEWAAYFEQLTGSGFSASWGRCDGELHQWCRFPPQVDLGVYPIRSIVQVLIDGVVIPADEYRVDNNRLLVRVRPTITAVPTERWGWPTCQSYELPDTQPGTFSVDVQYGMTPPASGLLACSTMAAELALAMSGKPNRLPARVTSIVRQGVSMAILDPLTFLQDGKTGIYEVDLFLQSYNPDRQRRRPMVYSPDLGYSRSQTS